jgi:hypothetical protein
MAAINNVVIAVETQVPRASLRHQTGMQEPHMSQPLASGDRRLSKIVILVVTGAASLVGLGNVAGQIPSGAAATIMAAIILVAGTIALLTSRACTRPDRFHVQRTLSIRATIDRVVPLINDLRPLDTWPPFVLMAPVAGEPVRGDGAGGWPDRIEIVNAEPLPSLAVRLAMAKPLAILSRLALILEPQGDTIRVSWTSDGEVPVPGRLLRLILDVDAMIGRTFEAYLADLRTLAE